MYANINTRSTRNATATRNTTTNNNTANNVRNVVGGALDVAAAAAYHERARQFAANTRDVITGKNSTGSKAGDAALILFNILGSAANAMARDAAMDAAKECFNSVHR